MKKYITLLISSLVLGSFITANAQAVKDADPKLASIGFSRSAFNVGDTAHLNIDFRNSGSTADLESGSVALSVSFPANDVYAANPTTTAAISGPMAGKFNWVYLAATKTFRGVLNSNIPAGDGGLVSFEVIANQGTGGSQMLSTVNILRLNPGATPNDDVTNNGSTPGISIGSTPLPLNVTSFTAVKLEDKRVQLNWETSIEQGSDYFEVERSANGKTFNESIRRMPAAGYSKAKLLYQTFDNNPFSGANYYRLKIADKAGTITYSATRKVDFSPSEVFSISPNPATDFVNVKGVQVDNTIRLFSSTGAMVSETTATSANERVELSRIANGTYYIQVLDGTEMKFNAKLTIKR